MNEMRCTRCGHVVNQAGPPKRDAKGRVFWPPPEERPTQLDERYGTGYCSFEGRMTQTVRADNEVDAMAPTKPKRKNVPPADLWPEGTSFEVRRR